VIKVRALVVYESMFGNTHVVASNIADGLRSDFEVTLVPVAEASWDLIADADLLVAGAPTHMHGMSSRSTRRMAAEAAAKDGSGLRTDPGADGPGMRDWLGASATGTGWPPPSTPGSTASPLSPAGPAAPSPGCSSGTTTASSRLRRASWSARRTRCSTARPRGPAGGAWRSARWARRTCPRLP